MIRERERSCWIESWIEKERYLELAREKEDTTGIVEVVGLDMRRIGYALEWICVGLDMRLNGYAL